MTIKTITITEDAYDSIKRLKTEDESFSKLFLRLGEQKMKVKDLLGALKMSDAEADAFKKRVKEYRDKVNRDILERRKKCTF